MYAVEKKTRTSINRLAQQLGVLRSPIYRLMREDISLFPYKVQVLQKLTVFSQQRRLAFAEEFSAVLTARPRMLFNIWFSDECHFRMNRYVNKQNMRLWCDENPIEIEEAHIHPKKVMVWAAISSHGIIGPVFIRGTVTSSSYHSLIKDDIIPELDIRGYLKSAVYRQDGAKPHISDKNLLLPRNTFKNCIILNRFLQLFNTSWNWPPYGPDLNPWDYFLWGYPKHRVYVNNPMTPEALEAEIVRVMRDIPEGILYACGP